jgi:hypothetical protein
MEKLFFSKIFLSFLGKLFIFFLFCFPLFIYSQSFQTLPLIAANLPVADKEAGPGDILSQSEKGLVRATIPYDKNLFGVVVENPPLVFNKPGPDKLAVASYGEVLVKVSDLNGPILKGDFITSSTKPGVGQKATQPGFIIGQALENFEKRGQEGLIKVILNPRYGAEIMGGDKKVITLGTIFIRTFEALAQGFEDPANFPKVLRYIFALIIASSSFLMGFISFVKALRTGIEATGRNPLARQSIQLAMALNLLGIVVITVAALSLSILIILW